MKISSNLFLTVIAMRLFSSCTTGNASFSSEELRFTKPFSDNLVAVYKSETGQVDTITFLKWKVDTIKYRNLEQGFYNENTLSVGYKLTNNSFHKITVKGVGETSENLMLFIKAKNSHSSKEFCFLGLLFDESYLNNIMASKYGTIIFSQENAKYKDVNINEGIKSFTFSFEKGITSFIDKNNKEWKRIN